MEYLQITVATTSEAADLVAMILTDAGSEGISIKDDGDVKELIEKKLNWDYVDENLLNFTENKALVSGFFDVKTNVNAIYAALEELKKNSVLPLGSYEITSSVISSADWENEWRKYYAPIRLGKIVIVPAWQKAPENAEIPVFIEPGMAFGTGNHETTSMCVELMQKAGLAGKTVIDMGCGSGILGIAAAKLGAKSVILSDIDPQAVEASNANIALNGAGNICRTVLGDLNTDSVKADAVIANITADILLKLKSKLGDALTTGGYAVISGIINARANDVKAGFSEMFDIIQICRKGEWQAMLLKKK